MASVPNLLIVAPALGPKSVKELIAYAKAKPGQFNFSSAGIGSGTQINGEMFRLAAGIEATHVPYKGAVESLNEAMDGRGSSSVFARCWSRWGRSRRAGCWRSR